jgi:general secretion pathway protein J
VNNRGFTLLEVLIALVLLGMLLAALVQGMRFGVQAWGLQEQVNNRVDALEAADRSLRGLIEGMEPAGGAQTQIVGHKGSLSFIGTLPSAAAIERRADMTLTLANAGRLVLRWRPHHHEKPFGALPAETETVLLDGLEGVEFAYWRPRGPGFDGGWVSDWTDAGTPGLVRIHLQFGEHDNRRWPNIVVAPMREKSTN